MNMIIPTLAQIDSTALFRIGQRYSNEKGNVFLYLQGVASVITGDWVIYRLTSETAAVIARASSGSKGLLAIAMAATVASKYGWFQVAGSNLAAGAISGGGAAADNPVYLTGTAGLVDDVEVQDDLVYGALFSVVESSALAGVSFDFPFVAGRKVRPILTQIDATALRTVGDRWRDENGDEYIYLKGIASVVTGSVVSFIVTTAALSTTALLVANAVGHVGVAMAAIVAGKFGWFQVAGLNLVTKCDTSAAIGAAYIGGTSDSVDHTAVLGDLIHGMQISVADASNVCGVFMLYPAVTNASGL